MIDSPESTLEAIEPSNSAVPARIDRICEMKWEHMWEHNWVVGGTAVGGEEVVGERALYGERDLPYRNLKTSVPDHADHTNMHTIIHRERVMWWVHSGGGGAVEFAYNVVLYRRYACGERWCLAPSGCVA